MGVQTSVLHGQHPGDVVALVVMRVPPPRGRDEDAARDPVATNGIDDESVAIDLLAHERVHSRLRRDREIEGDGVVSVRTLYALRRNRVQQRPQNVRERLCLRARGIAE